MNAVITFALRQRVLTMLLLLLMSGVGIVSLLQLDIEPYPDPSPPFVDVVTQNPGQSAEEEAQQWVINRLSQLSPLPGGVKHRRTRTVRRPCPAAV